MKIAVGEILQMKQDLNTLVRFYSETKDILSGGKIPAHRFREVESALRRFESLTTRMLGAEVSIRG